MYCAPCSLNGAIPNEAQRLARLVESLYTVDDMNPALR